MQYAVLLMVIGFVILFVNVHTFYQEKYKSEKSYLLDIFPYTIILFYTFLFIETEILSAFSALSGKNVLIVWGVFCLINLIVLCIQRGKIRIVVSECKKSLAKINKLVFVSGFLLVIIMGWFACKTVLHNWDSMTYHLPRVAHWAQNSSIGHFATNFYMQVKAPVFAEYIQVNVYLLSAKEDIYMNMMQYTSYILCGFLVYIISRKIGCGKRWSGFASLLFLTMPIAFAEALTTQNDLITCVFLLCFVSFSLNLFEGKERNDIGNKKYIVDLIFLGASIGLATITKYYVVFAFAFMAVFIVSFFIKNRIDLKTLVISIAIVILTASLFGMPEITRLLKTYGVHDSSGLTTSSMLVNTYDPRLLIVNFLKNFTLNFTNHYIYNSNNIIDEIIIKFAHLMGVDVRDPRIGSSARSIGGIYTYYCDTAGAYIPALFFIIILVIAIVFIIKKKKQKEKYDFYVLFSIISIIVFFTLMKSTQYRTRYELPYFAMLCPAISYVFGVRLNRFQTITSSIHSIAVFLCICEFISLCSYQYDFIYNRQNGGKRPDGYFTIYYKDSITSYNTLHNLIEEHNIQRLGLYVESGLYEYPIWAMNKGIHIENIFVEEEFEKYIDESYIPEAIILIENRDDGSDYVRYQNFDYQIVARIHDDGAYYIFAVFDGIGDAE